MSGKPSGAPAFGGCAGKRWSIGSTVNAFYWTGVKDELGVKRFTERQIRGLVVRIRPGGPEGWIVTLSPLPGKRAFIEAPEEFNPAQIELA